MAHQQPQPRPRLKPEQFDALWDACDSNDIAPLEHLMEMLDPPVNELTRGVVTAVKGNHLNMVRYLLERGVPVKGWAVQEAIRAGSIPALEILREFGWEVNMKVDRIAWTALE
jgi:hypothetical protein